MSASGDTKGLSASVLAGSDEVFDIYCEPCSIDNLNLEAVGFCSDCKEYLCKTCYRCHRRLAASKNHTVLDKSCMPITQMSQKIKEKLTEKCKTHPDNVIEYFCNVHNALCCSVCLIMNHRNCSMSYIPEVSDGIAGSKEYQQIRANVDTLVSMVTGHQIETKISTQNNEQYHIKALAEIKKFRNEINKLLDKLERDVVREISRLNDENKEKLNMMSAKCQSLSTYLKGLVVNFDENVNTGKHGNLFVQMKQAKDPISDVETDLKDNRKWRISRYMFQQDEKLQEMTSTLSALWSLSVRQETEDTTARYIQDVNVKSADDANDCYITGIAVLTEDRIVVTDYDNKSVKLVDVEHNKVICSVALSSPPCDITVVNDDQVAVALGDEKKIEIFSVSNTLLPTKTIKVHESAMAGLQFDGQRFLTACQKPGSVKVIDMSGKVLSTFSTDNNGEPLFTMSRYIALSRDHNVLYVTDMENHTVTCMTVSGKVISVYKHDKLKRPKRVAVDTDGSVYVCSEDTDTVHHLTPTGTLIQILLGQENGLSFPYAIEHDENGGKLYISSASFCPDFRNFLKVFQLV